MIGLGIVSNTGRTGEGYRKEGWAGSFLKGIDHAIAPSGTDWGRLTREAHPPAHNSTTPLASHQWKIDETRGTRYGSLLRCSFG